MATPFIADLEEIVYPSSTDHTREDLFRIDARRVLVGMFVARLDRPWTDTPLPQTGLLVVTDDEITAIRKYCRHVIIDPVRSAEGMLDAIKAASVLSNDQTLSLADADYFAHSTPPAAAPDGAAQPADDESRRRRRAGADAASRGEPGSGAPAAPRRNDVHPTSEARSRVRSLLLAREGRAGAATPAGGTGAVARLRSWFGRDARSAADAAPQATRLTLRELSETWGASIGSVEPGGNPSIRDTLADARPAHARLVAAADAAVSQVRQGGTPSLEALGAAVDAFVAALQRAPDAMRWVGAMYVQCTPLPNPAVCVALRLVEFGRALGMPAESLRELALIGLLCDLGKALLPRELLEQPGVLASHDYALVQQHVSIGLDLLSRSGELPETVLRGIAEHHERLDGSGYPRKLRSDAIGLYGRMAAIVDSFCGLTALRAYANPLSVEDALSALHGWSGTLFCRDLVEHFILAMGVFPVGTLVELRGGEVAAVVDRQPGQQLYPRLVVLTGADKGPLRPTRDRAGEQDPDQVYSGAPVRIARGLPSGAYGLRLSDYYARPAPR